MPLHMRKNNAARCCVTGPGGTLLSALVIALIISNQPGNRVTFALQSSLTVSSDEQKLISLIPQLTKLQRQQQRSLTDDKSVDDDRGGTDDEPLDNEWVVKIVGGARRARRIARTVGYKFIKAVLWAEQQRRYKRSKRDSADVHTESFNDPFWSKQWNLRSTMDAAGVNQLSMNVIQAWKLGYTGQGVVVTILDDGIQHNHSDLIKNYDQLASYDLNDDDPDPMPKFDQLNGHGTRCAGEVAMTANNSICGVGIAHRASIGGVRMLDGKVTDRVEAEALSYNIDHIDIYSVSWGPTDDGKTVEGPGILAQQAIINGIKKGRQGKGAIYVWASGNGGLSDDDCGCDGYIDSIYTLTVSSVAADGTFPWYAEKCAAVTTDIGNKCTSHHSGTSASAPMAAGVIALGLEANPRLTWRDVQHITIWTSNPIPLLTVNEEWIRNGRGLYVNSRFGFGIMDAEAFVLAAKSWQNVAEQRKCTTVFPSFSVKRITDGVKTLIKFHTDGCRGQNNEVSYIEHIQLVLDVRYPVRGHLSIALKSPQGTRTQLLSVRRQDNSKIGFRNWPFMSVHSWGENPLGIWELHVEDKSGVVTGKKGTLNNITMIIYGTLEQPEHYTSPRNYDWPNTTAGPAEKSSSLS